MTEHAPALLDGLAAGPVAAATVLRAWSHPGRIRSEAAFHPDRGRVSEPGHHALSLPGIVVVSKTGHNGQQ